MTTVLEARNAEAHTQWTVIAFTFGVEVCIIYDPYLGRKASKLKPVEALRYE